MNTYSFSKLERLKSRKKIASLFERNESTFSFPVRLIFQLDEENVSPTHVQFSASVSRRKFKKAVDRNRIKRLMREAYRLQKLPLTTYCKENGIYLSMMGIYVGNEILSYRSIYKSMGNNINLLIAQLEKTID